MRLTSPPADRLDILQGTLDLLILRTLTWGPQHGHGIGLAIRQVSEDVLHVPGGSLYPAVHRLEKQGLITSEWKQTDNKQRAKFYRLTAAGRKQLQQERARWTTLSAAMARVLGLA